MTIRQVALQAEALSTSLKKLAEWLEQREREVFEYDVIVRYLSEPDEWETVLYYDDEK